MILGLEQDKDRREMVSTQKTAFWSEICVHIKIKGNHSVTFQANIENLMEVVTIG